MSLLPPSTNDQYRGAAISAWFLTLAAALTIVPGAIHYLLPDGGAGVIAHLDLTTRADTIIAIFAWYGAMQIPFGMLLAVISVRYRTLVPLCLLACLIMQGLSGYAAWFGKGSHGNHHPPEHYASAAFVVFGLIFFILSLRAKKAAARTSRP